MKTLNNYYLQSFEKYAAAALDNILLIRSISNYAQMLNVRANEILKRAADNEAIDISKFHRELFEIGRTYVRKFASKQKELNNKDQAPNASTSTKFIFSDN